MSIITLLVVNLGGVASCVPFSKPFADYVQSGILGGSLRIKKSVVDRPDYPTGHALQSLARTGQHAGDGFLRIPEFNNAETIVTTGRHPFESPGLRRSSLGSDDMIIKQTTGFAVCSEPKSVAPAEV